MSTAVRYRYTGRDTLGRSRSGLMEAADQRAVAARLREQGVAAVTIEPAAGVGLQREITLPSFGSRVSLRDLAVFSRQFATMIDAGLSLLRALAVLSEQTDRPELARILTQVRADVEEGGSLSSALAEHDVFPRLYVAMVRAGETAGTLDTILMRIATALETEAALRRRIRTALTYPAVILVLALLLTVVMLIFIVPTFVGLFTSLGGELPLPTRIVLALSTLVRRLWPLLLLGPIVAWQVWIRARRRPDIALALDRLTLRAPVFGTLFQRVALARFARTFGVLLGAGVPILGALDVAGDTIGNRVLANALNDVKSAVREGDSIAEPLAAHPVFPPMIVQMIAVGEETGTTDEMLSRIADFYDSEVEALTDSLTATIEPLMIAVLGGLVGSIIVALYLPMFRVFDLIQ